MKPEHKDELQKFASEHDGKPLDQKALLKPNPMMAKVLIARILSMTPEQQQALKSIVTPETSEALAVLLPELASAMAKEEANGAG